MRKRGSLSHRRVRTRTPTARSEEMKSVDVEGLLGRGGEGIEAAVQEAEILPERPPKGCC